MVEEVDRVDSELARAKKPELLLSMLSLIRKACRQILPGRIMEFHFVYLERLLWLLGNITRSA